MTRTPPQTTTETSLGADVLHAARYYLGGRRALLLASVAIAAAGLVFNWNWLVAAGLAPLLLSVLPCVMMCTLGLCMSQMTGASCSKKATTQEGVETTSLPATIQAHLEEEQNTTDA